MDSYFPFLTSDSHVLQESDHTHQEEFIRKIPLALKDLVHVLTISIGCVSLELCDFVTVIALRILLFCLRWIELCLF